MGTERAREKYKLRCQTAEWSNAQCRNRGFWFFLVRGCGKVKGVGLLHAIAHNILQAIKLRAAAGLT